MTFTVNLSHVRQGKRCDSIACPVAMCLRERLKPRFKVEVAFDEIRFLDKKTLRYKRFPIPRKLLEFICAVDDGGRPDLPFTFELTQVEVFFNEQA